MSSKTLNIGLFGFGCVGFGLYEVLSKTPTLKANIRRICVKDRTKARPIDPSHFVFDAQAVLGDEDIKKIVEALKKRDKGCARAGVSSEVVGDAGIEPATPAV